MKTLKKISGTGLLALWLFIGVANAQIVNVESQRMQNDSIKLAGHAGASFSYQQNNEKVLMQLSTSAALQLRSKSLKDVFLMLGSYEISKSNSNTLTNAGFAHLRYTRKFNSYFRWEVFMQYQSNPVLLLKMRLLAGTGPRFKILNNPGLKSSLGTLYMFEHEKTQETVPETHNHQRISAYFTFTWSLPKKIGEFSTITYYQPRIDYFNDFRITNQTALSFGLGKHIAFVVGIRYLYDAFPPEGVIRNSFSSEMGVKANF
ncbi:MAG TPA: DUF481 domain-containing protein [Bacteroidales bacterium]|nr:DUF481 domain-containing protein [Bacteroidales bacterium]